MSDARRPPLAPETDSGIKEKEQYGESGFCGSERSMNLTESITFVVPVSSDKVFRDNFGSSPIFCGPHQHQIIQKRNYHSAAKAYNAAIHQADNDLLIFAHQDVLLPESYIEDLERALKYLEERDPYWGVLGCFGVSKEKNWGYLYDSGQGKMLGKQFEHPIEVQTLDEIVLIVRKSSGLRFDDSLPHFHLYGTDICLAAAAEGRKNYAISAFCLHNTNEIIYLGKKYYECYFYIKKKYKDYLPIYTSCVNVTRMNEYLFERLLRELYIKMFHRKAKQRFRSPEPLKLLSHITGDIDFMKCLPR